MSAEAHPLPPCLWFICILVVSPSTLAQPPEQARLADPGDRLAYRSYLRTRISPDGRTVLFAYGRQRKPVEVWTVPAEGGEARRLTVGALLNRSPDGRAFFLVRDPQTWRHDWDSGRESLVHPVRLPVDGSDSFMVGALCPDLTAGVFGSPRSNEYFVFDAGKTVKTMDGCEPGFEGREQRLSVFRADVKQQLAARPESVNGIVGRDGFLFFRGSLEYLLAGDLRRQPHGRCRCNGGSSRSRNCPPSIGGCRMAS